MWRNHMNHTISKKIMKSRFVFSRDSKILHFCDYEHRVCSYKLDNQKILTVMKRLPELM